ncbi:MAG: hypothetical protein JST65_19470 [Acidobacteria bacterium]|nr:hypothetical protein [Acidobacteriota bacterium]
MKKIVFLSLIAPAILGLAACGDPKVDNTTVSNDTITNIDDTNLSVDDNATVLNDTVPADNVANAN